MSGKEKDDVRLTVPKFSSFKSKGSPPGSSDAVPKFASFKSKEPKEDRDKESREKRRDERDHRDKRHRSERDGDEERHRHHHSKRRRHHHHHREHRSRSRSHSPRPVRDRHGDLSGPRRTDFASSKKEPPKTSDVFFIDKKGDPLIVKYGGIERSKIPVYRRYGGGQVLGTPGRLIIHRDGPRDEFSLRMPGEGSGLFGDKDGLRAKRLRLERQAAVSMRPRRTATLTEEEDQEGFLSLSSSKTSKGNQENKSDSSDDDDEAQPNYRSIEGKAKARPLVDSESSEESGSDGEEAVPLDQSNPLKWRSIQLSRRVKEHPDDIDAWMELVNHQDDLLRSGEQLDHTVLENEAHSYSEIKVSMLESALKNTSRPADRNRVLNYLMREGVKVWNPKTTAKKWSEVQKDEENNFLLWKTHLDFCMSDISSLEYDQVKNMLVARLRAAVARSAQESRQNDFSEAIYVFLRTTRFIHDAGYKELAVAAWQALLEMTFFRPRDEDSTSSFQDFWESEVPRIGEADALGWAHFVQSGLDGNPPEPVQHSLKPKASIKDAYRAWAATEKDLADTARLPARTMDEGTEDDPFRVVMFDDIEPLLFVIPETIIPQVRSQLLDAFLLFCGLPPYSRSDEWTTTAWADQFLTGSRAPLGVQGSWEHLDESIDQDNRRPPAFSPIGLHAAGVSDILFQNQDWFRYLGMAAQASTVELDWVCSVTRRLTLDAHIQDLAAYYLALSSLDTSVSVKKVARTLLKQYPTDLGLYDAYALAEDAQGHRDVAVKVLSSAVDIGKVCVTSHRDSSARNADSRFQGENPGSSLLLWRSWAWMELEAGHKHLAVKRLCSSVDGSLRSTPDSGDHVTGSQILKARHAFSSPAAPEKEGSLQVHAECLALLAYLTTEGCTEPTSASQGNITAAMDTIDKSCQELRFHNGQGTLAHEGLLQFAARLLYFNATRGYVVRYHEYDMATHVLTWGSRPSRRVYIREQLTKFLTQFPQNTVFLSLLEWSDSSLRVVDETRTLLHEKVLIPANDCVSSRLFAIEHELSRGNANTTKAAFDQAVRSDACRSSTQVWTSYVRFCHAHMRHKAKDVFYRALKHCPWSKTVTMEAFGTLAGVMSTEELRAVYNTMSSKGMRIHVDLDEFVKARGRQG